MLERRRQDRGALALMARAEAVGSLRHEPSAPAIDVVAEAPEGRLDRRVGHTIRQHQDDLRALRVSLPKSSGCSRGDPPPVVARR